MAEKPVRNIAEAIERVMLTAHSPREMDAMGMWNYSEKYSDSDKRKDENKNVNGKFKPISFHEIGFDSQQNQLEPSYY